MKAANEGHADVVKMLLSAGANLEAADKVHYLMMVSLDLWAKKHNTNILCRIETSIIQTHGILNKTCLRFFFQLNC